MEIEAKDIEAPATETYAKDGITPSKNVGTLHRSLKARHVQFLALSGAIGTGLFVGSGQVLSLAGPLSAFLAYAITGFNLYCVINSLGEMAAYLPLPGSTPVFAARYVDEALGFTLGWNYWYQFAIGVPIEISAAAVVIGYWPNAVPTVAWIAILFVPMVLVNLFPVRIYGEVEFGFGAVKLTAIVGLLLLMLVITCGGGPDQQATGFRYWDVPGPMLEYLEDGALGRFLAFWKVFVQATFSYGGSEMVVVAAGETENPRRNVPKAVRRVFWRILIFYVLAILLVGLCVSANDPRLLDAIDASSPGAAASPFVVAVQNAGIAALPSVLNAVVLTSAWSAGNSFFYSSTRILYAAASDGKAPAALRFERFGVPYACVAATALLSCLVFLNAGAGTAVQVFFWFANVSAVSTLVVWGTIAVTYLRFHGALRHNGMDRDELPFKSPLQPFLAWFALGFSSLVALFNGFDCFFPGRFSARTFLPPYIDIPIFLALFLGYKIVHGTKFVKVQDMDLWSGKAEIDRLEPTWPVVEPKNFLQRMWFWIA
ncbi:MAG: hypothetical protein LQ340_000299 [Diploschistes diacapsis]|nr:MAG: hypothetical protein LQ340_000299 [Diploschistes diacapsis]